MNNNIQLTDEELQLALTKLEVRIQLIKLQKSVYFNKKGNPKSIDYILSPGIVDWTGISEYNHPFFSFNQGLSDDIKDEVIKAFIEIVNEIKNPI